MAAVLGYWSFYLKFVGLLILIIAEINVIISLKMGNYTYLAGALHYNEESVRIIDRMNALKINPFEGMMLF